MSDRKTALLEAAIREIATHGTRGMRVERVAKLAGVSPALIYFHFEDRSTLLKAALAHIGDVAEVYTTPAGEGTTGRERLLAIIAAEIQDDAVVRQNSTAWSELRNSAIFDDEIRETFAELTERWERDLADLVVEGQRDGSINAALDPRTVSVQLSTLVEGVSGRWLCRQLDSAVAQTLLIDAAAAILRVARNETLDG
jgi:AcrR family transcriptional regulator